MDDGGAPIRTWRQRHDNGWIAGVIERDGLFVGFAAPETAGVTDRIYPEDCLEHAQAAAEFALRQEAAHECSDRCEPWHERIGR